MEGDKPKRPKKDPPEQAPKPKRRPKPKPKTKAKIGRPKTPIAVKDLRELAGINCSVSQAAAWFKMSDKGFRNRLAREVELREAWNYGKESGKVKQRKSLYQLGEVNAAVAIFLAKNTLGMKDVRDLNVGESERPVQDAVGYNIELLSKQDARAFQRFLKKMQVAVVVEAEDDGIVE